LGDNDDTTVVDSLDEASLDRDTLTINGGVENGAKVYGDDGNDDITVWGDPGTVAGLIDMGKDDDRLYLYASVDSSSADLDGGKGTDYLFVDMTETEWQAVDWQGNVTNFEKIVFEDNTIADLPYVAP